jgi:hypothetical protein
VLEAPGAFAVSATPAGDVPSLRLAKQRGGVVHMSWEASCSSTDVDDAVYQGRLGDFSSHVPLACSTGGANTFDMAEDGTSGYFLVVPLSPNREGSYGVDGDGRERPAAGESCIPQSVRTCP